MPPNENYEILFEDLYKEHDILKKENENLKNELILLKKSDLEYRTINEYLKNLSLIKLKSTTNKQIKCLTQNKSHVIEKKQRIFCQKCLLKINWTL